MKKDIKKDAKKDIKKEIKKGISKKAILISMALIAILGFIVYFNSLGGEFLWDDLVLVKNNLHIQSWSNIKNAFTESIGTGGGVKDHFYRPIQMISFIFDYSLWKLDVRGYHITNILFHIMTALSIYWLINILFKDNILSLLAGLFFVVHPIHTEAVTYISGRADSLALIFMLIALIFYIKASSTNTLVFYFVALLSSALALFSRENALILPAFILLYHYIFNKEVKLGRFIPILMVILAYILLRLTMLSYLLPRLSAPVSLPVRLPGVFAVIILYLKLLFVPFGLHVEYGYKLFNLTDPKVVSGFLIALSALIYAFSKRKTDKIISFSIFWFFITFLPVSNIYSLNAYMSEHWMYVPSVGFFIILAKAISSVLKIQKLKFFSLIFVMVPLGFYSYLTIKQNTYWSNQTAFYERNIKYAPDSSRLYCLMASVYKEKGKDDEAIALYEKAVKIAPQYPEAHNNLGTTYGKVGRIEEAIASFKKAIELNPNYAAAYSNLGIAYCALHQYELAIEYYNKAKGLGFINPSLKESLKPFLEQK